MVKGNAHLLKKNLTFPPSQITKKKKEIELLPSPLADTSGRFDLSEKSAFVFAFVWKEEEEEEEEEKRTTNKLSLACLCLKKCFFHAILYW